MEDKRVQQDEITVGKKIQDLRRVYDISQERLSGDLGVSRQTVSKWERNIVLPNACSIECLCTYFKVNSTYFIGGEDYDKLPATSANNEVSSEVAASVNSQSVIPVASAQEAILANAVPVAAYNAAGYAPNGLAVGAGANITEYNGLTAEYEIAPVRRKTLKEKIISVLKFLAEWVVTTGIIFGLLLLGIYIYIKNYPDDSDGRVNGVTAEWDMMVLLCMAAALVVLFIIFIIKLIIKKHRIKN